MNNIDKITQESLASLAKSLGVSVEEASNLLESAAEHVISHGDGRPSAEQVAEILKFYAKQKRIVAAAGKIIEQTTLINESARPKRNGPCPTHPEFKFKKCPHGCARGPRKMIGRVTRKAVRG